MALMKLVWNAALYQLRKERNVVLHDKITPQAHLLSVKVAFERFIATGRKSVPDEAKSMCRHWSINILSSFSAECLAVPPGMVVVLLILH